MNETAVSQPEFDSLSRRSVHISTRFLFYCTIWFFAGLALSLFAKSDATDSERLTGILLMPVAAVFGLAMAMTWPVTLPDLPVWPVAFAAGLLALHGLLTLTRTRAASFAIMIGIHAILLTVGVIYMVRFSNLPSGP